MLVLFRYESLVLSHSDDGCHMFAFVKVNGQSGRKYDHKGVFNKHIDEVLSSAKGYPNPPPL